jgi:hypothetical protein
MLLLCSVPSELRWDSEFSEVLIANGYDHLCALLAMMDAGPRTYTGGILHILTV